MTDKQQKLFGLFKEIDEICKNNGIVYYMAGGSALGVVRHRGFIPWDDDMDILMTRDNWLKFIEVCKTQMRPDRIIESPETDRGYCNMFGRYVDRTSTAIHVSQFFFKDVAGFVIDIFVLDPIANKGKAYSKYVRDIMLYSDLINNTISYSFRWDLNRFRYPLCHLASKVIGKEPFLKKTEKELFTLPEEDAELYVMRWGGIPFLFEKEMYAEPEMMPFNDMECMMPHESVAYLVWHYGDEWMFIPPHAEHESHDAIYSIDKAYPPMREEILSVLGRKAHSSVYQKRKNRIFRTMRPSIKSNNERVSVKVASESLNANKKLKAQDKKIKALFEKQNYFALNSIFAEYFAAQLSADSIGREDFTGIYRFNHPMLLEIDKEYAEIAILTLMSIEKISKAMRLIELYEIKQVALSQKIKEAKDDILKFRKAVVLFSHKKYDEAFEIAKVLLEKYPHNISFIKLNIRLLEKTQGLKAAKDQIEKLCALGLKLKDEDGDFIKHKADLLFLENKEAAIALYFEAFEKTTNGIVHLEIHDVFEDNFELVENYVLSLIDRADNFSDVSAVFDDLFVLFENDMTFISRFVSKCLLKLFESEKISFFGAEKKIRYLLSKSENDLQIEMIYGKLLTSFTGSEEYAKLYESIKLTRDDNELSALSKTALDAANEKNDAWLFALAAIAFYKLGDSDKSFELNRKALDNCESENENLKKLLRRFFYSDLKRSIKIMRHVQDGIRSFENGSGSTVLIDGVSNFSKKYPTVSDAVDVFVRLGIFDEETLAYIELFDVFSVDGTEKDQWSKHSIVMLKKICRIMHSASIEKDLLSDDVDDDSDFNDVLDSDNEASLGDENDYADNTLFENDNDQSFSAFEDEEDDDDDDDDE